MVVHTMTNEGFSFNVLEKPHRGLHNLYRIKHPVLFQSLRQIRKTIPANERNPRNEEGSSTRTNTDAVDVIYRIDQHNTITIYFTSTY